MQAGTTVLPQHVASYSSVQALLQKGHGSMPMVHTGPQQPPVSQLIKQGIATSHIYNISDVSAQAPIRNSKRVQSFVSWALPQTIGLCALFRLHRRRDLLSHHRHRWRLTAATKQGDNHLHVADIVYALGSYTVSMIRMVVTTINSTRPRTLQLVQCTQMHPNAPKCISQTVKKQACLDEHK